MLFTNIATKFQPLPRLTILNKDILQVYQIKFLGITIDRNLTFKHHISNICIKLSRAIALLVRVKNLVPIEIIKVLYYVHVYPHLVYCNPIWSTTNPCHLYNLNILHKKITWILTNSDFLAHTPPLFKLMNILQLSDISKVSIATYMFKHINSTPCPVTPLHLYSTRNKHTLSIPRHNLTKYRQSLMYQGPSTWNSIPQYVKQSPSISLFKNKMKCLLLSMY